MLRYFKIYFFLCLFYTNRIFSNAIDTFGFSPNGVALTGAMTASVNDWSAPFYNMAGVTAPLPYTTVFSQQKEIEAKQEENIDSSLDTKPVKKNTSYKQIVHFGAGYLHQIPLVSIAPQVSNSDVTKQIAVAKNGLNYGFLQAGLRLNLNNLITMPFGVPLALGLGLQLPSDLKVATVVDTNPPQYNFQRLGYNNKRLFLTTGLSLQIWKDVLSIGAGVNIFISGQGSFKVSDVNITTEQQLPKNEIKLDFGPAISPNVGFMFRQKIGKDNFLFGASYQGELVFKVTPLTALAQTTALDITLALELVVLYYYTPHTINTGFSYLIDDKVKLHLDTDFQLWSRRTFNPALVAVYKDQLPRFEDIWSIKFGTEYRIGSLAVASDNSLKNSLGSIWLKGGYRFQKGMTPDQRGITNYLDNDKHSFGLGLSYVIPANIILQVPTELSFGGQYQYWVPKNQIKNYETQDLALASNNPSYKYSAHVLVFSAAASWKF